MKSYRAVLEWFFRRSNRQGNVRARAGPIFGVVALLLAASAEASAQAPPGWEPAKNPPPSDWIGPIFEPSFDFPNTMPASEARPWEQIDFTAEPERYLNTVLDYVFEGQDPNSWRVQDNSVRHWYPVPWMVQHGNGREFVHGLTRERNSLAGELGPKHKRCTQAWAVGFYNPLGGYTLHQVFGDGTTPPNMAEARFPVGTVVAKVLLTEANEQDTSIVRGAPEWDASINAPQPVDGRGCALTTNPRTIARLRLLQFDVAVRDSRADKTTGWVFGTFIFDPNSSQANSWRKLRAVGLMWGNDPDLSDQAASRAKPRESIVLYDAQLGRPFGRGGRMNGPVDNSISSCLSCHSTAMFEQKVSLTPRQEDDWDHAKCWFRNIKAGEAFGKQPSDSVPCGDTTGFTSLDYSLQLSRALINYSAAQPFLPESMKLMPLNAPYRDLHESIVRGEAPEIIFDVQR